MTRKQRNRRERLTQRKATTEYKARTLREAMEQERKLAFRRSAVGRIVSALGF